MMAGHRDVDGHALDFCHGNRTDSTFFDPESVTGSLAIPGFAQWQHSEQHFHAYREIPLLGPRSGGLVALVDATGEPAGSVERQVRYLRAPRFGSFLVSKRHRAGGTFEYRVERAA